MRSHRNVSRDQLEALLRRQRGGEGADEAAMEVSLEDLREFLEADLLDVPFDPEFKQSLRDKLWELVRTRNRQRR